MHLFFNASGEAVSSSFSRRRISLTLEELKKIPCKIGVASGLEKKKHCMVHYLVDISISSMLTKN